MSESESYDVVVVGGGAAGLSGAVALSRFRRSVLVVDAGETRNSAASHVHNFLTRDGTPPAELYAAGRAEVARYGGRVETGLVRAVRHAGETFDVELADRVVGARRVLLATGLRDELPDVPGLRERWGQDVLHCPYCHGWEVRDQRVGVLATGPLATHQALLFRQLTPHVTVLGHTGPAPTEDERAQLHALGIPIVDGEVVEVEAGAGGLSGVRLDDGRQLELDVLVVSPRLCALTDPVASLGLAPVELVVNGHVIGTHLETDATGATAVPGVWASGNVANAQAQVITSAAGGLTAAAAINADLIAEDARRAVAAHRREPVLGEHAWDERYRAGGSGATAHTWSGEPNPVLVTEIGARPPGIAFDAGAGEGGDARWLAARGWQVTAADISSVALDRARARAEQDGLDITWLHLDLSREPVPGRYDLVTSHYVHIPAESRPALFARLADAVAPGGTLLVVGHDPSDLETPVSRPGLAEMGWTADEVAASLGPDWTVEIAEARPRTSVDPTGQPVTIHDAVLRARRAPDQPRQDRTGDRGFAR